MKWSELHLKTLRENPAEASIPSHILLLRAGFISMSSQGIYVYNSLFLRSIQKLSNLIRQELEKQGAREIAMPMVQSKEIWKQSQRWDQFEGLLLKMKGRTGTELCLGPTHEELIIDFVKPGLKSWRDMPFNLYQIQNKYRDEIRPRFGLMRAREFLMKDAYSFDRTSPEALQAYDKMSLAYKSIFDKLEAEYTLVKADSGAIGGNHSEEFHILADKGEDELLVAEDFSSNVEVCPRQAPNQAPNQDPLHALRHNLSSNTKPSQDSYPIPNQQDLSQNPSQNSSSNKKSCEVFDHTSPEHPIQNQNLKNREEFATPGVKSISDLAHFLSLKPSDLVKILFFETLNKETSSQKTPSIQNSPTESFTTNTPNTKPSSKETPSTEAFAILCLGDDDVNPIKVKQELKLKTTPTLADTKTVFEITGAEPGSCGPYGLKKDIPIYLDHFLKFKQDFITGANKTGFHLKNVNPERDFKVKAYGDFCFAREGDLSPQGKVFKKHRGIEVGHLFYLGDEYSKKMDLSYLNKEGKKEFVEMGCYGLGVTRTLQAIIEQKHDDKGMIWPLVVAPFAVHICLIDPDKAESLKAEKELLEILNQASLDYFIDDRKERPGIQFKDADLIGLPLRISLGLRDLKNQHIEIFIRSTGEKQKLTLPEFKKNLPSLLKKL